MSRASEKDWALLDGDRSPNRSDSIHDIIARLEREIDRGEQVYTSDELARLERKLSEYRDLLRVIVS